MCEGGWGLEGECIFFLRIVHTTTDLLCYSANLAVEAEVPIVRPWFGTMNESMT